MCFKELDLLSKQFIWSLEAVKNLSAKMNSIGLQSFVMAFHCFLMNASRFSRLQHRGVQINRVLERWSNGALF